ncbi:PREDICTED: U2 small nuclear ribonucleoprotein auxiliary factor 35 kDa subunit-related protein 2-like [Elephantulus edwardii]|uniref:U2 small nuclear ribonucleoprotein auxiliary factor 35 kDa subunit-related protein 2-like n=1 Tax=Elephantulus edwardii TaxID=28737 RepID=UPI0003F0C54D|nr:PREDICTED: U2 small nuclear ribonucleoprotein auxiliary factor 35 kDa subunit-related protein 2-like [Elephantulus edwardii]
MATPEKKLFPQRQGHRQYRSALKKEKRRKRRQELARLRDSELPQEEEEAIIDEYQLEEEKLLETERKKLHEEWLQRDRKAQEEFRLKKEKEEAARKRQEELERRLKEEWEEQQRKEKERKLQEEKEEAVQKTLSRTGNELGNGSWQNPEPPLDLRIMERDPTYCPFYSKTGACRFGDRCSRRHNFPTSSPTLLIKSMFSTFGMEQCRMGDYDPDAGLEYSEEETYQQFLDFYDDVLPEFQKVGRVVQFKVSCNADPHLRGNVYVQYESEKDSRAALALFNGRWYAGRQLRCEFCPVTRWHVAICGRFESQQCSRGAHCNFLHVFRNPKNEFWEADRDLHLPSDRPGSFLDRRERTSHHGDYYGRPRRRRPSSDHSRRRNGGSERRRSRYRPERRPHKDVAGSRERQSSRSRGRKRDRSPGPRSRRPRGRRSHSPRSPGRRRGQSRGRRSRSSRSRSLGMRRSDSPD